MEINKENNYVTLAEQSSDYNSMSRATIKQTYNNQTVFLEFSETLVLLNSVCRVSVDFRADNGNPNNGHKGIYILNNWKFDFDFTDNLPLGKIPLSAALSFEDNNKTIVITYYKWYGEGVENSEPLLIESVDGKTQFLVKIKTSAFQSRPNYRIAHISIWRKI